MNGSVIKKCVMSMVCCEWSVMNRFVWKENPAYTPYIDITLLYSLK